MIQIYFDDEGTHGWVRISDVTASGKYLLETEQRLSALGESLSVRLEPGRLIVSIAGSVGKPVITGVPCCIHDGFVYFVGLKANPEFVYYLFLAGKLFMGLGKLGTQLNLNTDTIGSMAIPVPSMDEQAAIVAFLDAKSDEHEALINRLDAQLSLLRERRQALVTAAVTGQIDVSAEAA